MKIKDRIDLLEAILEFSTMLEFDHAILARQKTIPEQMKAELLGHIMEEFKEISDFAQKELDKAWNS